MELNSNELKRIREFSQLLTDDFKSDAKGYVTFGKCEVWSDGDLIGHMVYRGDADEYVFEVGN